MGLCASKPKIEVIYGSRSLTFYNRPDLATLQSELMSKFPELLCNAFFLEGSGSKEVNSNEDLRELTRRSRKLRLVYAQPQQFPQEPLRSYTWSIFKLRLKQREVAGTGFLLSPRLALTTMENFMDKSSLKEYSALFPDSTEIEFHTEGIFVQFPEGEKISFALVELAPTTKQEEFLSRLTPVKLQSEFMAEEQSEVTVLYYTRAYPVLQATTTEVTQLSNCFFTMKEALKEGSSGAPVFNHSGELVGIFSSYNLGEFTGSALNVKFVTDQLRALLQIENEHLREAIHDVWNYSSLENHNQVLQASFEDFDKHTCFIDQVNRNLIVFGGHTYNAQIVGDLPALEEGGSAVATPYGVMITSGHQAWIFNKVFLREADMTEPHSCHSSVYFRELAVVISGRETRAVEGFNFDTRTWETLPELPKTIYLASVTESLGTLYLYGGQTKRRLSNNIFSLTESGWEIRSLLPEALVGLGALRIDEKSVLLFGGNRWVEAKATENTLAYEINLNTCKFEMVKGLARPSLFSSYQPAYTQKEAFIYSNTGDLLRFTYANRRFFDVRPEL